MSSPQIAFVGPALYKALEETFKESNMGIKTYSPEEAQKLKAQARANNKFSPRQQAMATRSAVSSQKKIVRKPVFDEPYKPNFIGDQLKARDVGFAEQLREAMDKIAVDVSKQFYGIERSTAVDSVYSKPKGYVGNNLLREKELGEMKPIAPKATEYQRKRAAIASLNGYPGRTELLTGSASIIDGNFNVAPERG